MAAPQWASALTARVCEDYRLPPPNLVWRRSRPRSARSAGTVDYATGRTFPSGRIVVTAGADRKDAKLVLLHELAHYVAGTEENHNAVYWRMAWTLYRVYGVPLRYALWREHSYRKAATEVAADMGVRGAKTVLARSKAGKCCCYNCLSRGRG